MKKLNLKALELGAAKMLRHQLKNAVAGYGPWSDSYTKCCDYPGFGPGVFCTGCSTGKTCGGSLVTVFC